MRCLGIIPARGGSKGIPRKNLREVAGLPLIGHTIRAAARSTALTSFVTSSDDDEILRVAKDLGSPVVRRDPALAADDTPTVDAVLDLVNRFEGEGRSFDAVVLLQPTAPLRIGADIDGAIALCESEAADSVVSVYRVLDHHPARMYTRAADATLVPVMAEPPSRLRQDLPPVFHRNGAVYVCRTEILSRTRAFVSGRALGFEMPRERSVNIDDEIDLAMADLIMRRQGGR